MEKIQEDKYKEITKLEEEKKPNKNLAVAIVLLLALASIAFIGFYAYSAFNAFLLTNAGI